MVKVYCDSDCSTCRKALNWLDENRIDYTVVDIRENHPDEWTLRRWRKKSGLPLQRFFNTSSQRYREMGLSKKLQGMSEKEMYKLLASDGMLVSRPLVVTDHNVLAGFREAEWMNGEFDYLS